MGTLILQLTRNSLTADMEFHHLATILLALLVTHRGSAQLLRSGSAAESLTEKEVTRRLDLYTWTYYQNGDFGAPGYYYEVIEDPSTGTYSYAYDCTGFVWHVLWTSSPQAYEDASNAMDCCFENGYCPSPSRWVGFMQDLVDQGTIGAWQAVYEVTDLRPGDILVKDTHTMIVYGTAESTDEPGIYRLLVADSTDEPHMICDGDGDDTRITESEKGTTGQGTGYIRVESGMTMAWCMCCGTTTQIWAARPMG